MGVHVLGLDVNASGATYRVEHVTPTSTAGAPSWDEAVPGGGSAGGGARGTLRRPPDRVDAVMAEVERRADQAVKRFEGSTGEPEGTEWDGWVYYPLVIGEATSGVLAVETTGEGETREAIGVECWGRRGPSWASPVGTPSSLVRSRRTESTTR